MIPGNRFQFLWALAGVALWIASGAVPAHAHSGHDHSTGLNISLPDVLAQVNGKDIGKDSILDTLVKNVERYKERGMALSAQQQKVAAKKLLEEVIHRNLLLRKAQTLGVSVSAGDIDAKVGSIKSTFKNEMLFQKQLKMRNLTLEQYRKKIRDDLLMDAVLEKELAGQIQIPGDRIREYFEENKNTLSKPEKRSARVILIKVDSKSGSAGELEARKKLEDILAQLKQGKSFEEMATMYSQDSLATRGGDLGYFTADSHMFAPFRTRAFQLNEGEVSDIFRTPHGLQILKVTDVQEGFQATLENSRETVRRALVDQELKKRTRPYLESLKKEASVKVYF
ncbi:peptidylprolyl isomerase [Nitrospina watsonii]|uniref:Peptidylprolyl isomerase, PpiC-type n=1 Tax=Nitrospina watsonii TaxID=1323948 RepID=A0ABN8W518_9BACT|nr:peptidylprolyl isomerase [Nitrospina watsonii]CAI2719188.1 Putative Peptidylprolyl isomerase, PpiC-type [Nitrospina watsonii]